MAQSTAPRLRSQADRLRTQPAPQPELGLEDVLPKATILRILAQTGGIWKSIFYTPWVTFWTFFWQVLSPDPSCRSALKRLAAWMGRHGRKFDHEDTSPYCKARARLPEAALERLMRWLGSKSQQEAPTSWRWCGRVVKVVDGTTLSMPDTLANQKEYPQSHSQKPGLGFPLLRLVVVFCLATGSVLEAAIGPYKGKQTGENTLFRRLWEELDDGDVILGDRYYSSYFDLAMLKQRGVDSVCRLHQRRCYDFRQGRRLGPEDQITTWTRPERPDWMDEKTYDEVCETLQVRIMRIHVHRRGFRTQVLLVVTTLLDSNTYTKEDIATLYRRRWDAELHLRSIKVVLGLDVLRCKTPEMVRKEIWMGLLGYNVIRAVMVQASVAHKQVPWHISFKGALQGVQEFGPGLREGTAAQRRWLQTLLWESIAQDQVGNRPDRVEPRARKRRPKQYPLLTKPRREAKKALLEAS